MRAEPKPGPCWSIPREKMIPAKGDKVDGEALEREKRGGAPSMPEAGLP